MTAGAIWASGLINGVPPIVGGSLWATRRVDRLWFTAAMIPLALLAFMLFAIFIGLNVEAYSDLNPNWRGP